MRSWPFRTSILSALIHVCLLHPRQLCSLLCCRSREWPVFELVEKTQTRYFVECLNGTLSARNHRERPILSNPERSGSKVVRFGQAFE